MVKRFSGLLMALLFCAGLLACASGEKHLEIGVDELSGPIYEITVRTMLRDAPEFDSEATGVMAPGSEVFLKSFSEDNEWALVAAPGTGDVIFKGWVPSDRITPADD